ncbi:MFS transporter [Streptomyces sp. CB03911]|uniref:MFS transporter n=1 Tax=Streptomycetaceae TaxID=2062 RepID=UPI00093E553F|nr:MFS transporter [Streptomyces sp. CB03911]OKI21836.1 transporter [Streptomyces sp. CB03911]
MPLLNKTRARSEAPYQSPSKRSAWSPARLALTAFFAMDGFLFAAWVVRIPDIRGQVSATHSALGLALLCLSAGAVATMPVVGRLCVRYGSKPVTIASVALLSLAVPLPAHTHSVLSLGAVLLLFGAGYGAANVAMNSAAVDLVRELRRPVMPSFHAGYSLGGLLGAGIGGLLAGTLSTTWALALSGALGLAVTAAAGTALLRGPATAPAQAPTARRTAETGAEAAGKTPAKGAPGVARSVRLLVVLLGLTALLDAYGEGAIADWATLHLTDDVHATAGLAAAGYAAFAFAMTAGRVGGTWLSIRIGQTRLIATGGLTACAGMLVVALAPSVAAALAGLVLVGLGLANIFPLAIAQAGAAGGPRGVATASTLGYAGMLIGPPVIGFLADAVGLPLALTTVAGAAALAGLLPFAVRARRPAAASH